ncbi:MULTISPECIES: BMP family protein [Lysinibacillus]|uniref:BMP family ABC transporter substrate-binding protein n=1 Tax=Lysinibacillus antri TaxID=2498145 RepID=A0A3S0R7P3_9BACI|nr:MULTISPECIES: BMP family protein [Lysinibacillus]RUL55198.1 BMP family ABC transporter substrate-binding protein [Lysinibacillus antri]TSI11351.1 BMP family ABC transporter substrate-binding protein [Lysinibacillus sp. BW-2-10]
MKKRKFGLALASLFAAGTILAACGGNEDTKETDTGKDTGKETTEQNFSVAMVTDTGGVDDRSFNQSTWEGIKAFGEENGLEKGDGGYDYLTSAAESDYVTNLNSLIRRDFDLVFAVGFALHGAVEEVADQQPDAQIAIIDEVVQGKDNVASIMFRANEASYLAGVAAALESKSGKIGFIGGMEGAIIGGFQAGFEAGVAAVNPDIKVDVQYAGSFTDEALGRTIAKRMYDSGVDIIFHAAGGVGKGLFAEAVERKKKDPEANVWAIGVDRDQYDEGKVDDNTNITLTSVLKRVDVAAQEVAKQTMEGNFPGGELITYGLSDQGVDLADSRGAIAEDTLAKVEEYKQQIIDGTVTVPEQPEK